MILSIECVSFAFIFPFLVPKSQELLAGFTIKWTHLYIKQYIVMHIIITLPHQFFLVWICRLGLEKCMCNRMRSMGPVDTEYQIVSHIWQCFTQKRHGLENMTHVAKVRIRICPRMTEIFTQMCGVLSFSIANSDFSRISGTI